MLSFLHPYVAVIIDFIESIDDFMEKNGGEFNSYVLSIMLIVIGYAKFIQKAKKAKVVRILMILLTMKTTVLTVFGSSNKLKGGR